MALGTYKLVASSYSSSWRTQNLEAVGSMISRQQISLGWESAECKGSFSSSVLILDLLLYLTWGLLVFAAVQSLGNLRSLRRPLS